MDENIEPSGRSFRRAGLILGALFLVAALAAAAYVAGRWMKPISQPLEQMLVDIHDASQDSVLAVQGVRINVASAEELPQYNPDAWGMFVERENNSIYIGTGSQTGVTLGPDGPVASYDGPLVEVVVTQETVLYRDVTEFSNGSYGGEVVQQKIEAGSLDDLIDGSQGVRAWGRKVGDRVIADVLLYSPPWIPQAPPGVP